jgi:hypothetical protein
MDMKLTMLLADADDTIQIDPFVDKNWDIRIVNRVNMTFYEGTFIKFGSDQRLHFILKNGSPRYADFSKGKDLNQNNLSDIYDHIETYVRTYFMKFSPEEREFMLPMVDNLIIHICLDHDNVPSWIVGLVVENTSYDTDIPIMM